MNMTIMQRKNPTARKVWLEILFLPVFIGKNGGFWKQFNLKKVL